MLSAYVDLASDTLALVDKSLTKGEGTTGLLDSAALLSISKRPSSQYRVKAGHSVSA